MLSFSNVSDFAFMKKTQLVLTVMTLLAGNMNAGTQEQQIIDTVSTIFTAASTDDVAKFDSFIAPEFYSFDGGIRFNGDSIMAFVGTNAPRVSGSSGM